MSPRRIGGGIDIGSRLPIDADEGSDVFAQRQSFDLDRELQRVLGVPERAGIFHWIGGNAVAPGALTSDQLELPRHAGAETGNVEVLTVVGDEHRGDRWRGPLGRFIGGFDQLNLQLFGLVCEGQREFVIRRCCFLVLCDLGRGDGQGFFEIERLDFGLLACVDGLFQQGLKLVGALQQEIVLLGVAGVLRLEGFVDASAVRQFGVQRSRPGALSVKLVIGFGQTALRSDQRLFGGGQGSARLQQHHQKDKCNHGTQHGNDNRHRRRLATAYDLPMATTSNASILAMLDELITLTALKEGSPQSFKVRGYEKAKLGLQAVVGPIADLSSTELVAVKGVGKSTANKIREFIDAGAVAKIETLRKEFPPEVVALSRIPGLGPKTLKLVRSELGVENVEDLKAAIESNRLRTLPGLGATSEAKIAKAIERLGLTGKDHRTPIADALPLAERLVDDLEAIDGVERAQYCGSLRRFSETIGDIDITVAANDGVAVMDVVRNHPEAVDIVVSGDTKTSFLTAAGLQIDVRVVEPKQFGAATLYFTGSKAHNIELRQRALDRNMTLNEYGLFHVDPETGETGVCVAQTTEAEIYEALDLSEVAPPMREATGEVEAADRSTGTALPELVKREHIRGDLHYHTDRSGDGRSTVAEMVAVGAAAGYQYLAITDHGEDLAINGSSAEEMLEHREVIRELQGSYPDMRILWGCELNIDAEGGMDYEDDFRAMFDYTVASVHSHFDQSVAAQTDRLLAAIADPTVHSIGHLTGRSIGRRPGIEIDVDVVLDALVSHDVALEINGALQRLDAASDVVRQAVAKGVKLVINTDSHHTSDLGRMEYGVLTAQRGWAPRDLVINTWEPARFFEWLGSKSAPS